MGVEIGNINKKKVGENHFRFIVNMFKNGEPTRVISIEVDEHDLDTYAALSPVVLRQTGEVLVEFAHEITEGAMARHQWRLALDRWRRHADLLDAAIDAKDAATKAGNGKVN